MHVPTLSALVLLTLGSIAAAAPGARLPARGLEARKLARDVCETKLQDCSADCNNTPDFEGVPVGQECLNNCEIVYQACENPQ